MGIRTSYVILLFIIMCINLCAGVKKVCKKEDFQYTYTQCRNQTRWRVAVPGDHCRGGKVSAPEKKYPCEKECPSGKRLSPTGLAEQCADCPKGTYSIRGGLRFDDWEELPAGFQSVGERGDDGDSSGVNCTGHGWVPSGRYLASPSNTPCSASLRYTVNIRKAGELVLDYKYSETIESLFTVEVLNDQCQAKADSEGQWIPSTKTDKWRQHHVKLEKGRNRVFVTLIGGGKAESAQATPTVLIRRIEISNVAFTQHCTKCGAGTFASEGATKCSTCHQDTFSKRGAEGCSPCPKEKYSPPGASQCLPRPLCNASDFYFFWGRCEPGTGKMVKRFAWTQPKVCRGGVSLPSSDEFRSCAGDICNPGSFRLNATDCAACPADHKAQPLQTLGAALHNASGRTAADGCASCPANTQPVRDLRYTRWWSLPPQMSSVCVELGREEHQRCPESGHWRPMGDHVRSGAASGDLWFSMLSLHVQGFDGAGDEFTGELTFDFRLFCKGDCQLFFMMDTEGKGHAMVRSWTGAQGGRRLQYSYALRHRAATKFVWVFDPSHGSKKAVAEGKEDYAVIYSVNASNVVGAPAIDCQPCRTDAKKRCIPCPSGQFYSAASGFCVPCPPGHVVWRTPARSKADCRPCGPGMRPHLGNSCVIDLQLRTRIHAGEKKHDLRPLSGNESLTGVHLFTTRGTEYHHVFMLTIDNSQPRDKFPVCESNLTTFGSSGLSDDQPISRRQVRALVCQYTLVPPRKKGGRYLTAQPVSLGDRLVNVTSTNHSAAHFKAINARLEKGGWPKDEDNLDLHLTYVTAEPSRACHSGRNTLVTLRCDPKAGTDRGHLSAPPKCPDGTCDGCNFHFMWKTRQACPICDRSDYDRVKGECRGGKQELHYYPPKYCYFSVKAKHEKIVEAVRCPIISSEAEIGIIVAVVMGVVLVTMLGYSWKRNRRLEYKYMKLVEGQGGRPGELPQAESCAVHEGEEDDEDVHIKSSRGGGSSAFFSRFKQFRKTNTFGGDRSETANLTDRDEFGL